MWILHQYRETGRFLREKILKLFVILCIVFIALCVVSALLLSFHQDALHAFFQQITNMFEEKQLFDDGGISFPRLLLNNVYASAVSAAMGCIPFLFLPVLPFFSNAVVLGAMAAVYQTAGINLAVFAAGILPHGVLELPALVLSFSLGLYLCWTLTVKLTLQRERSFAQALANVGRVYVLVILPLLLAAALIETYVTPMLMGAAFGS